MDVLDPKYMILGNLKGLVVIPKYVMTSKNVNTASCVICGCNFSYNIEI